MPRSTLARLPGLLAGLGLFGLSVAVMAQAGLGLGPWEALHQGISRQTGVALGSVSILVGVPVLALWWPIGVRPGIGTLLNIAVIGLVTDRCLPLVPAPAALGARLAMMLAGVVGIGIGSGLYLAADLGPGPRDGLMTGLHHRFGWPLFAVRTAIELMVLAVGWLLGGTVGIGTLAFAVGIGPVVQGALGVFDRDGTVLRRRAALDAAE